MKKIPEIRFPEFSGEWVEKRLGEVCDVRDGTHESPKYIEKGYPLITSKNLSENGKIDFSNVNYISQQDFEKINKRSKVNKGDILFGMIGTIGNPVIVDKENFAIKNVALIKEKEEVKNKFLFYYLNSNTIKKQFFKENVGGTQKFIALNVIRKLKIHIPPTLTEQQKIANFLSSVDEKIEIVAKKIEELKKYQKGLLQKLLNVNDKGEPELRFEGFSGKWVEKKFTQIFETISTKSYQIKSSEILSIGKYPVIDQGQNKIAGYSDKNDKLSKNNKGIIIFGDHTTILKYIDFDFIVGADGVKLIKSKSKDILKFLYYELLFHKIKPEGYKRHFSILKQIKLHLPPTLAEQERIAEFLSSIDEKIETNEKRLKALKEYKKGLLQKMFV